MSVVRPRIEVPKTIATRWLVVVFVAGVALGEGIAVLMFWLGQR